MASPYGFGLLENLPPFCTEAEIRLSESCRITSAEPGGNPSRAAEEGKTDDFMSDAYIAEFFKKSSR
ncbi:hypothetical protein [Streptomyces bottropensis]|uniref:hypothetical protein n=1 Tax=Streptomyces bottropensis TaxID=42235 RepID=UPI0036C0CBEF